MSNLAKYYGNAHESDTKRLLWDKYLLSMSLNVFPLVSINQKR